MSTVSVLPFGDAAGYFVWNRCDYYLRRTCRKTKKRGSSSKNRRRKYFLKDFVGVRFFLVWVFIIFELDLRPGDTKSVRHIVGKCQRMDHFG